MELVAGIRAFGNNRNLCAPALNFINIKHCCAIGRVRTQNQLTREHIHSGTALKVDAFGWAEYVEWSRAKCNNYRAAVAAATHFPPHIHISKCNRYFTHNIGKRSVDRSTCWWNRTNRNGNDLNDARDWFCALHKSAFARFVRAASTGSHRIFC